MSGDGGRMLQRLKRSNARSMRIGHCLERGESL
jgi:hypothetical protein